MPFLREAALRRWPAEKENHYPFALPFVRNLGRISFDQPVTFFVGENGSGKSTLLEGLACTAGSIAVGSESVHTDPSLAAVREFSSFLQLVWRIRTRKGFFLRAEDFFGYARRMAAVKEEYQAELARVDEEYAGRSKLAQGLARMPFARDLAEMRGLYGEGLDSRSHGESFLTLFQARFVPGGLYLLDEPEAPLSPLRQLSFLALLKQMVEQDSQFIVATHSPLILAFPGAVIYEFDGERIRQVDYDQLEHVKLTRDFLNNPESFLRHL